MFKNYYCYILIIPVFFMSMLMIFLSTSWFSLWLVMEINLILFISLIIFDKMIKFENLMMYYLVQSLNSYLYLLFSMLDMSTFSENMQNLIFIFLNFSMLMKMGFPPFIQWYIKLMNNLNWMNIFILSIIQKIIPLYILMSINYLINEYCYRLILLLLILSMFYSCVSSLSQINLKLIMSYSSVIQMSWIINLLYINEMMMIIYFLVYSLISLQMFFMFMYFDINNLNDLFNLKLTKTFNYLFLMFSIMSLGGLPPMSGFVMKWISIQSLFNLNSFFYLFFMILVSLISLFFYLRIIFPLYLFSSNSKKLNWKFINLNFTFPILFIIFSWFMYILLFYYEIL
uniref:NADH-ubiquinone oxidoreductase chain 2 n=1 Tax=Torymus sp. ZJUH_2016035 TaxID=2491172 RepID=A0A3S8V1G8_9HYME|nr:NADH dehydrogenase subunit 2 [Torymus sp. ZJUH_2016035]